MEKILLDGIEVKIERKNIKNMYLRIKGKGEITVTAPVSLPYCDIESFVLSKKRWIKRGLLKAWEKGDSDTLKEGSKVGLFGQDYILKLDTELCDGYYFEDGFLTLYVGNNNTYEYKMGLMADIYRRALERVLPEYIEKCQSSCGIYADEWRIKRMKTRWGSCNTKDKRIWLSVWLASRPTICLEATIYHELAHLKHKGHGKDFYDLLLKICPFYYEADRLLKK
jgi:predicted metal-dependent hydrolase